MSTNDGTGPRGGGLGRHRDQDSRDVLDSRTEEALRRVLGHEAAGVNPTGDGLSRIRARTARASAWPTWSVPLAAAAAGLAVAGGIGWVAIDGGRDPGVASGIPTPVGSARPTDPADPTPAASAEGTRVAIPVYYVGAQPGSDGTGSDFRLFREFHPISSTQTLTREGRIEVALGEMLANDPLDPDYRAGVWPEEVTVRSVTVDDETDLITVDLGGLNPPNIADAPVLFEQQAAAVVQQLVFTVTAAASYDGFQAPGVDVVVDGEPGTDLFGVDISGVLTRDTGPYRAAIWILSVDDGATETSPLVIAGEARLATGDSGRWVLSDGAGTAADGTFGTGLGGEFGAFDFTIDETLAPGSYTLELFDIGVTGEVSSAPYDSKTFVVEGPS